MGYYKREKLSVKKFETHLEKVTFYELIFVMTTHFTSCPLIHSRALMGTSGRLVRSQGIRGTIMR